MEPYVYYLLALTSRDASGAALGTNFACHLSNLWSAADGISSESEADSLPSDDVVEEMERRVTNGWLHVVQRLVP